MKNLEIVKIRIENLREVFKFLLLFILTLLTGIVTLSFWILTKKVDSYFIVFVGIGIFVLFFVIKAILILWNHMNDLLEEVDNDI